METIKPRFRILKQGYDRFEVDRYMQETAQTIAALQEKLGVYQSQVSQTQNQLLKSQEKYTQLSESIRIREKAADEINRLALREANKLIHTATNNADEIIKEALSGAKMILLEVSNLAKEADLAKQDMRGQVEKLTTMIDEFKLPTVPSLDWLESLKNK